MPARLHTGFLQGPGGHIPLSIFTPPSGREPSRWIVHVPAFAEEMNKCRPMVARQARRLAEQGAVVLVPDLAGTGDSEQGFEAACWQLWLQEVRFLLCWSAQHSGAAPLVWGVRLGCLLALEAIQDSDCPVSGLLMWQPVLNGAQHLNQFLRLRTAAGMLQEESESVSDLRGRLAAGEDLEIAGYPLSAQLFAGMEDSVAAGLAIPAGCPVAVHEVVAEVGKPLLPVTVRQVTTWQEAGVACDAEPVPGSPFWLTQEIGFAPQLVDAGCAFAAAVFKADSIGSVATFVPELLPVQRSDAAGTQVRNSVFACAGEELFGQLHLPSRCRSTGVVIVVGGPQYRVGSHRQFLQLAAALAASGVPVLRFDYRGMGDSGGELAGFLHIQDDIRCAVDTFFKEVDGLESVVLWGLCDAATASVAYAPTDARVQAMVLANPWVYSEAGEARAYLKHYYRDRLFSADFWRKFLRGDFDLLASLRSMFGFLRRAGGAADTVTDSPADNPVASPPDNSAHAPAVAPQVDLGALLTDSLARFDGSLLLVISGNDLTAAQFMDTVSAEKNLSRRLSGPAVQRLELAGADHTFSECRVAAVVEQASIDYVLGLKTP